MLQNVLHILHVIHTYKICIQICVDARVMDAIHTFTGQSAHPPGAGAGFCNTAPGMQLAVLHVAANATLYEMDILLSPAEYPPVEALVANQPPFGTAQIKFPSGVPTVVMLNWRGRGGG